MFKKLSQDDKDIIKIIAASITLGACIGILAMIPLLRAGLILKDAKWTPQGDMMLTFFNRSNAILIARPGS